MFWITPKGRALPRATISASHAGLERGQAFHSSFGDASVKGRWQTDAMLDRSYATPGLAVDDAPLYWADWGHQTVVMVAK
jgi:hypothetical protein